MLDCAFPYRNRAVRDRGVLKRESRRDNRSRSTVQKYVNRLRHAALGKAAAFLGALTLVGCSGSYGQAIAPMPGTVTDTSPLAVNSRGGFHSATHHYSVRQVKQAFAAYGVQLRNVSPKGYRGLLAFLDGRPSHAIYAYVSLEGCKCIIKPPIRNARITHHGNVTVAWRPAERSAVRAALRALH